MKTEIINDHQNGGKKIDVFLATFARGEEKFEVALPVRAIRYNLVATVNKTYVDADGNKHLSTYAADTWNGDYCDGEMFLAGKPVKLGLGEITML